MKDQPSAAPERAAASSIEYPTELLPPRHSSTASDSSRTDTRTDTTTTGSPESRSGSDLDKNNLKGVSDSQNGIPELNSEFKTPDGRIMSDDEKTMRRAFRGEFDHGQMNIPAAEQGLRNQSGLPDGGAKFVYDPEERSDGLRSATRSRQGDKDIIAKDFQGREDGLVSERLSLSPASKELVRDFADSSQERLVVNQDKSREFVRTNADGSRLESRTTSGGVTTTESFDEKGNRKSINPASVKASASEDVPAAPSVAEPLKDGATIKEPRRLEDGVSPDAPKATGDENAATPGAEDPKAAKQKADLEQFRKGLEKSNFELSPIKNGKGPFQSLRQMQKNGQINMSHEQMATEARRISKRHFEESGTNHFVKGDKPKMYSAKEIDQRVEAERQRLIKEDATAGEQTTKEKSPAEKVDGEETTKAKTPGETVTGEVTPKEKMPDKKAPGEKAPVEEAIKLKLPGERSPEERLPEVPGSERIPGSSPKILDRVTDPDILKQVPDALYIGQEGTVTSTKNKAGETKPYWLSGDAARALADANKLLEPLGKSVQASNKNGAGRTIDTQTEIYQRSKGGSAFAAGRPTKSNHVRGRAMDISNHEDRDVRRALLAVGFKQGDSKGTIRGDEHHWSFPGSYKGRTDLPESRVRKHERDGQPEGVSRRDRKSRLEPETRPDRERDERSDRESSSTRGVKRGPDTDRSEKAPDVRMTNEEYNRNPTDYGPLKEGPHAREERREREGRKHRERERRHRGRREERTSRQEYRNQENVREDMPAIADPQGGRPDRVSLKSEPTISAAQIDKILQENKSPAANEKIHDVTTGKDLTFGQHLYKLGVEYGVDPAIALGFFKAESTFGKFGKATRTNSFGNIKGGPGFRGYDTFADGARDWFDLVTGEKYFGDGRTTLGRVLHRYAPSYENDTEGYIREVAKDARRWAARGRANG